MFVKIFILCDGIFYL